MASIDQRGIPCEGYFYVRFPVVVLRGLPKLRYVAVTSLFQTRQDRLLGTIPLILTSHLLPLVLPNRSILPVREFDLFTSRK